MKNIEIEIATAATINHNQGVLLLLLLLRVEDVHYSIVPLARQLFV